MGRKAKISEERVFTAIRLFEKQGKAVNAGALKTYFGVGCAVRYDDLLNQYFLHGKVVQSKAEQLEAVLLPTNICDLVEQLIITQSDNYRNDLIRVFYADLETESKRTESMRLVLEEHKTQHSAERKYFSDVRGLAAKEISILNEKILGLEGELELHKSEILDLQARIVESHNSFIYLAQRDSHKTY
jgi:hypothetical protein